MCPKTFNANACSALTMLQSAFVNSAIFSRKTALRIVRSLIVPAVLVGSVFCFQAAAQEAQPKKDDKKAESLKKEEKKVEPPSKPKDAKNIPATAEQVAESVILIYAYPGGREKMTHIRKTEIEKGKLVITNESGQPITANYSRWALRGEAGK